MSCKCLAPFFFFFSSSSFLICNLVAAWKHRFSALCLSVVHDQAFGAKTPSYKDITELDKKVRGFYIPPSLQIPGFGNSRIGVEVEQPSVELTMQRYVAFAIREMSAFSTRHYGLLLMGVVLIFIFEALFYMHRGFFAQGLDDNPNDPMGSKYGPSVLAAYRSACSFVGLIESLFKQHPVLTERMWFLFTRVFSCSVSTPGRTSHGLRRMLTFFFVFRSCWEPSRSSRRCKSLLQRCLTWSPPTIYSAEYPIIRGHRKLWYVAQPFVQLIYWLTINSPF